MYIRLGNTNITYNSSKNDFIIFGEVLDSSMGYEFPVLVRTEQELKIWFGDNYKEYYYFKELLDKEVVLYLSKPISPDIREEIKNEEGYVDYSNFTIFPEIITTEDLLPEIGEEKTIYNTADQKSYIWLEGNYIELSNLPQNNTLNNSSSFDNRDTLTIGQVLGEDDLSYSHPHFNFSSFSNINDKIDWSKCKERIDELQEGSLYTLAFDFPSWPEVNTDGKFINEGYLVIDRKIFYNGRQPPVTSTSYDESYSVQTLEELKTSLRQFWKLEENQLISNYPLPITYYYSWDNLEMNPNLNLTREILSSSLTPILNLWSRTIGRPREDEWEEDNIEIKIEEIENKNYRISISRYGFLEVFEGGLEDTPERIDYKIEKSSKLIHAEINSNFPSPRRLKIGIYQMRGATKELNSCSGWFKKALSRMTEGENELYPDFFLIPDLEKWSDKKGEDLRDVYEDWLKICTQYSLQFLIQNTSKNYIFNLTTDHDNRLVWFFGDMTVKHNWKPGYYIFITGLLQDIYSLETSQILYLEPDIKNPYEENSIEKSLIKYKSNYLVCNNIKYYYKEYQNGQNYTTTIWMRFILGKITRELQKNKGNYLISMSGGKVIEEINTILGSIENRFSIIRSIELTNYTVNNVKQMMNLTIETTISDLINNSITLDVNINLKN